MSESQSIRRTPNFERGAVRDIRGDLRERLEAASAEAAAVRSVYEMRRRELEQEFADAINDVTASIEALQTLIDREEQKFGSPPVRRAPSPGELKLPLADFIVSAVGPAGRKSKDEVKDMVERAGYVARNESAGRAVHTTLINLVKNGRLNLADGYYSLPTIVVGGNKPLFFSYNSRDVSQSSLEHAMQDELEARKEEGPQAEADEPSY